MVVVVVVEIAVNDDVMMLMSMLLPCLSDPHRHGKRGPWGSGCSSDQVGGKRHDATSLVVVVSY
jgi:hypothetical protein